MTGKKDDQWEDNFHMMSNFEKRKLLLYITDDYMYYLFDELVHKRPILTKDEFWYFIKKRYTNKISFVNAAQTVQLASKYD